jgi:hypothetical protein
MPKPEVGFLKACNILWALERGYRGADVAYGLETSEKLVSRIKTGDPKIRERYPGLHPIPPAAFRLRPAALTGRRALANKIDPLKIERDVLGGPNALPPKGERK